MIMKRQVLVLHEKHCDRYIDIPTPESLYDAFLSVVKGRFGGKNDFYLNEKPTEPRKPSNGLTDEQIAALPPDGVVRLAIDGAMIEYRQAMRLYRQELEEYNTLAECLNPNTPLDKARKLAKYIMDTRQHSEYEGWDLVALEDSYTA